MLFPWLVAGCFAATPGGFRVGTGLPVQSVGLRSGVLLGPDDLQTWQATTRVQLGRDGITGAVELPIVGTGPRGALALGVGQLHLEGRWHFGRHAQRAYAFGLAVGLPVAPGQHRAWAWVTVARETVPALEALGFAEVALLPDTPLTLRAAFGVYSGAWFFPAAEVAAAWVVPVVGPLAAVIEAEAIADPFPLSARGLLRLDTSFISLDAGVQETLLLAPEPQWIAQARSFF